MSARFVARLGAYALLLSSTSIPALAQDASTSDPKQPTELEAIIVEGDASDGPAVVEVDLDDTTRAPAADGADFLRSVPGVSAGRMSGHGLEAVIRGQQQNQLNIIDAGAFTYGGCPSRMDPPTASAGFDRADRVIVERGYHTVTNGPGGSGGAVILERMAPKFENGEWWKLSGSSGFVSNSNTGHGDLRGALSLGGGLYAKAFSAWKEAENYEDGDSREVRSAFRQYGGGGEFGVSRDSFELAASVDYDKLEDAEFPGMDSPLDEVIVYRLRGRVDVDAGPLKEISANAFLSQVDHVMDNYSLRPLSGSGMMGSMYMSVPTESDTIGGKIEGLLEIGETRTKLGVDVQSNNRDATSYMSMMRAPVDAADPSVASEFSWPDVTISQYGVYAETEADIAPSVQMTLGARYDYVRASAGKADEVPGGSTTAPNDLYRTRYGVDFSSAREEHNLGGLLRFEYALTPSATIFAGVSRSVRTADATERASASSARVGNPDIAPEKHHQLDLGVEMKRSEWSFGAAVYADKVEDFILRDAFSVSGVTTYRNVEATLAGLELDASWKSGGFELSGDAAYTYGQNETDGRALAQIPPFSGHLTGSYGQDDWRLGARLNWALKQGRIDASRDVGETPGYAVVDIFGSYQLTEGVSLNAGVQNLFDLEYATHLNQENSYDPTEYQVNEPGRSAFVTMSFEF